MKKDALLHWGTISNKENTKSPNVLSRASEPAVKVDTSDFQGKTPGRCNQQK